MAKKAKTSEETVETTTPVAETPKVSYKELVADFLTANPFQNSRVAYRQFCAENPTVKVKQTYFYTLFVTFGIREKKKDGAIGFISAESSSANCMRAYKAYLKTVPENTKPVVFAYFLNLWKRHFKLEGPIRVKAAVKAKKGAPIKKVAKEKIAKSKPVVELSSLSAKGILAKANELLKDKAASLPTNLKNKTKIVKEATSLFVKEGYKVA